MIQRRLFDPSYVVDTSSFMDLDGLNRYVSGQAPPPMSYSPQERALVWDGLLRLARDGRIKLIRQVKGELTRWDPAALERVKVYKGHRVPVTNDLRRRYTALLNKYPGLVPQDPAYDPADPWLIVAAQKYGFVIVTEELPKAIRKSKAKTPPIPDICQREGILCKSLRELANDEGWLPPP